MDWENIGQNVDDVHLNHLRFADNIILVSAYIEEPKKMQDLKGMKRELKMNHHKTKIMSNTQNDITIDNASLQNTSQHIYLGHTIKIVKENKNAEIRRCIQLSWAAFGRLSFTLKWQVAYCQ